MQRVWDKIYTLSHTFIQYASLLLTGLLLISGLLCTAYSIDMNSQKVLYAWDNPLVTFIGIVLFSLVFSGISYLFSVKFPNSRRLLRFLIIAWYMGLNLLFLLFGKTAPSGDCYSVYSIAENLALGNTSVIHPTESYISYYPQQIGLVAFWEPLIRFWNLLPTDLNAYHFIKLVNALLGCVIILFQEKTVHLLWNNPKADSLYLILAGANCPLLMYASFIYGEIPSFAALSIGLYLLLKLLLTEVPANTPYHYSLRYAAGSLLFLTISVALRKNSLIFIIAIVLVVILWSLKQKRYYLLFFALFCSLCAVLILPAIEHYYEQRCSSTISTGVTATSYFAMGMQEGSRAMGWYNDFNFNTYRDSGMNTEAANKISLEAIRNRLDYFKKHPDYAARFYLEKYLSQWTDGSYASRQATLATFGGRRDFFVSIYEGEYSHYVIAYCNIYQNLMYLGAFVFCLDGVQKKRKKTSEDVSVGHSLPAYIGLIAVLGGFLFHMLWEANSRYIFLYGLALLPFAAKGFSSLTTVFASRLSAKNSLKAR